MTALPPEISEIEKRAERTISDDEHKSDWDLIVEARKDRATLLDFIKSSLRPVDREKLARTIEPFLSAWARKDAHYQAADALIASGVLGVVKEEN